ncbi:MAG: amino acid ABC transporter permease [Gemmatimonadetes bacterium]|nr:MAG: amino acid ABC transporter permease [Gemmatimonadota bacterium]
MSVRWNARALGQALTFAVIAAIMWWLARNTQLNLEQRGLSLGFEFLRHPANFEIGDTSGLQFSPEHSFGRAILIGLVNTARVAVVGCALSIVLGFVLGVLRLSDNAALRGVVRAAVELMRNTPILLLLLFLAATLHSMPSPKNAFQPLPGVFLSDRGLVLPFFDRPRLVGFNFVGGVALSPEFAALLGALVMHHAAHVSEIVRGAILGVARAQTDAALALGLSRGQALRFVVIPQALRAMTPLLATTCVSLTKNSSLAVAIGFPDVVSILNTTANQTGHSIETMLIMIAVYLSLSLLVAATMNRYNARLLRVGG